jgi:type IX secretion system PorP/SprF family membrane protein
MQNYMKKLLIPLSLVFCSSAVAQQIPQYSQYMRNQFMINPGAAGMYDFVDVTMSGRWQWVGFGDNGEPRTAYASFTKVLGKKAKPPYNPAFRVSNGIVRSPEVNTGKQKHAIGGQFVADQYGAFRRLNLAGTYAIHLPLSDKFNLSFGTRIGLSNNTFLADRAVVLNPLDPSQSYSGGDSNYDAFIQNQGNKYIMDIGAGLYVYSEHLFFGIATDHLSKDFVQFGSGTANFNTQIHFNLMGGVKIRINEDFILKPGFLVKNMRPAPFSVEGTLLAEYKEWMWFGFSYRNKDAIIGMFGLNLSQRWKLGYSYDFSISRMNQVSSGGHELVLGIMLR